VCHVGGRIGVVSFDVLGIAGITARTFGMLISLPTGDGLQTLPRLFIAVCFACALAPVVPLNAEFSLYRLAPEFLIGLLIAAPLRFLAEATEMFGELIDTARGQTIGSVVDPLNGQQGSDMATIMRLAMVVLAIHLGAFDRCVEAIRDSYVAMPLGGGFVYESVLTSVLRQGVSIISVALSFSSVWLVAYLVTDIAAGVMAKVTQGLQFTSTSTVIKMILTFILFMNLCSDPSEVCSFIMQHTRTAIGLSAGAGSSIE
jgi:flagellar biosynthesis protein FliR